MLSNLNLYMYYYIYNYNTYKKATKTYSKTYYQI